MCKVEKRDKQVGVSLTQLEFQRVREIAFLKQKSISQFIRDILLKNIKKEK